MSLRLLEPLLLFALTCRGRVGWFSHFLEVKMVLSQGFDVKEWFIA